MVALDEVESSNLLANQLDYVYKIYPLIDSVQKEIATVVCPIKKYSDVASVNKKIDVPTDCQQFLKLYNSEMNPATYRIFNGKIIISDDYADATYTLYYNKYPTVINENTARNTELEIAKECQEALVYGVCAGLTINDEPELYDTYNDRYNVMLSNILTSMQNRTTARLVGGVRL